jgi:preprotein translocase subunit SecE
MARNPGVKPTNPRRAVAPVSSGAVAAPEPKVKRPPFNPVRFWNEVRQEGRKITWTSWRETWITSVLVFIMVAVTGIFFLAVDQALGNAMQFLFKLASS